MVPTTKIRSVSHVFVKSIKPRSLCLEIQNMKKEHCEKVL